MKRLSQSGLLESALDILRQAASGKPYANQAQLARATGESEANISRWLSGASTPTLRKLEPVLMALGARLTLPGGKQPPAPNRKTRRSLILDSKPGKWGIPDDEKKLPPLLALEAAENDCSMLPAIAPGDVLLVDTLHHFPLRDGHIYLVRQPTSGARTFRRLCLQRGKEGPMVLQPDNLLGGYEPFVCRLPLYNIAGSGLITGLVVAVIPKRGR